MACLSNNCPRTARKVMAAAQRPDRQRLSNKMKKLLLLLLVPFTVCAYAQEVVVRGMASCPQWTPARVRQDAMAAYFSPSWTAFQADRGRRFSVIVDGISN